MDVTFNRISFLWLLRLSNAHETQSRELRDKTLVVRCNNFRCHLVQNSDWASLFWWRTFAVYWCWSANTFVGHHVIGYDAENYSRYGKSKVMPGSDHEGPEGKNRYSSDLSLTSALDGGWWLTPRRSLFTRVKETCYPLNRWLRTGGGGVFKAGLEG